MLYRPSNTALESLRSLFKRRVQDTQFAVLGDRDGPGARADVPGTTGEYYVRFPAGTDADGNPTYTNPTIAVSSGGPHLTYAGAPVYVRYGYDGRLHIAGSPSESLKQAGINTAVLNPLNPQSRWVYPWQLTYGLANAVATALTSSTRVTVKSFRHYTGNVFQTFSTPLAADKPDLGPHIPGTDEHCFAALWVDTYANTAEFTTSTPQPLDEPLDETDIQECVTGRPPDAMPFKVFYLSNDQTKVMQTADESDLRQHMDTPPIWGWPQTLITRERVRDNRTFVIPGDYADGTGGSITLESGARLLRVHKSNIATSAPTVNDDSGDGYSVGSYWFDSATSTLYIATDVTVGAAVWADVGSASTGITQLTGDVTAGPGSGSQAATLATVNGNVGTFAFPSSITANAKGLITAITAGSAPGTMSSFDLAGSAGASQTIANGQTATIEAGSGITTTGAATRKVTVAVDSTVVRTTGAQTVSDKTIENSSIGLVTRALGYFSALRLYIGGFAGIFTHSNSADRTYTLPNYNATLSPMTTQGDITYHNGTDNARLAKGTALQHLRMNAAGTLPEWADGLKKTRQVFASSGTWNMPTDALFVDVICISGGSGGGSGRRGAAGTLRCGGGGGAGGTVTRWTFEASMLSSSETVTVGTGGTGGAARSTDNTNGANGNAGGSSYFGGNSAANAKLAAITPTNGGGTGGANGATSAGGTGNSTLSGTFQFFNSSGGNGTASTAAGAGIVAAFGPGGGGGGGGLNASDASVAGGAGAGASGAYFSGGTGGGGAAGTAGGNGTAGTAGTTDGSTPDMFGSGGGGGGAASINAGDGGNGAAPGGGGGGGASCVNGVVSGAGGNGADGCVIVVTYSYS